MQKLNVGEAGRQAPAKKLTRQETASELQPERRDMIGQLLNAQRTFGNRHVQRMLGGGRDAAKCGCGTCGTCGAGKANAKRVKPGMPPIPRISVRGFGAKSGEGAAKAGPDKSYGPFGEYQDQGLSLTSFSKTAAGVEIIVEANGVGVTAEHPDGFKWTQTIETNVPLGGTTSPYVDPRPNDDTKPFYYTDAEHAASPTTFYDAPSRPAPATGTTTWKGTLCLNGVNEATKTVVSYECLDYGFKRDSTGKVTTLRPAPAQGADHRSILASEFGGWTFKAAGWSGTGLLVGALLGAGIGGLVGAAMAGGVGAAIGAGAGALFGGFVGGRPKT